MKEEIFSPEETQALVKFFQILIAADQRLLEESKHVSTDTLDIEVRESTDIVSYVHY